VLAGASLARSSRSFLGLKARAGPEAVSFETLVPSCGSILGAGTRRAVQPQGPSCSSAAARIRAGLGQQQGQAIGPVAPRSGSADR